MIENAIKYVKQIFADDCSGHDDYHTMRVYRLAMQIAEQENADMLIVQLAALLHDVDDVKLSPETHEAKKNAVGFMKNNGVDDKVIASVCKIIDEVSFAGIDSVVPSTIEGKCVQDADRLDAMGAIGIARTFAYGGSKGRRIHSGTHMQPDRTIIPIQEYVYIKELCSIFGINLNEFLAGEDIAQENMIQKPFKCDRKTVIRSPKTLLTYAFYRAII